MPPSQSIHTYYVHIYTQTEHKYTYKSKINSIDQMSSEDQYQKSNPKEEEEDVEALQKKKKLN